MALFLVLPVLSSCNLINDYEGDCDPHYKVKFIYKMNMLDADAFSSQVSEVDLYVFDKDGSLVWTGHEDGAILAEDGYMMDLPLEPGTYDIVAWCGDKHENAKGFYFSNGDTPKKIADAEKTLEREVENGVMHSSHDLHALFHGKIESVTLPAEEGTHVVTVPLTKNTNNIRIQLVHLDGSPISYNDFDFKIIDNNGRLGHDNKILDDDMIEYRAWALSDGVASTNPPEIVDMNNTRMGPITEVHSCVAELTTSRLQTCQNPILVVTRKKDNEKIIEIPLIDYFLMVKGEYKRKMTDDEFLDRQDDYPMTFFLYEDGTWYRHVLDILSWRVVRQSTDL